jgi:hypothetical protein
MAQADSKSTTSRLSTLFRDPMVRSAFERAERDSPPMPVESVRHPLILTGGAAVAREQMELEHA